MIFIHVYVTFFFVQVNQVDYMNSIKQFCSQDIHKLSCLFIMSVDHQMNEQQKHTDTHTHSLVLSSQW